MPQMINQATVLIIDDSVSSLSALSDLLEGGDYRIRQAQSGQSGIDIALQSPPDLIMLDIDMPDADGFEVCRQLKANTITADIPVIFVSGIQDVENKVKAFHAGGVDYITKPYQSEEVLARVMTQLQLLESRRNIEKARKTMEQWNATLEKHVTDRTRDIMRNERRMRFLAMHDSLTQLPNRNALQEALTRITGNSANAAVVFIGLEDFYEINMTMGHHTADEVIMQVADRMQEIVEEWNQIDVASAMLYRIGEDEFIIIMEDIDGEASVIQSGEALLARMLEPFSVRETVFYLPARAGFTLFPEDGKDSEALVQNAQMASDDAKHQLKAAHKLQRFHIRMAHSARERMERIHALRKATENQDLYLNFQPKVNTDTKTIIGMEALIRWKPDGNTLLPPTSFIPLAEETGIIFDLGDLVLNKTCRQILAWQEIGIIPPPIAINISPVQLTQYEFPHRFMRTLENYGIKTQQIIIEITESVFLHERKMSAEILAQLQKAGIRIHLDDFGTGYSSFSYLSDLPLDCVKIDRSFIQRCSSEEMLTQSDKTSDSNKPRQLNHRTILDGIITLAQGLHLDIIAEGVETPEQVDVLNQLGCNTVQGYYYYRPMEAKDLTAILKP